MKWLERLSRRPRRRLAVGAARIARQPFARLVRHFLDRLIRGGDSVSSDFEIGLGPLLGLLAAPGAFECFLMLDKYSSLMNWFRHRLGDDLYVTSAPDKFLFVSIAMALAGIVTILKWDLILPDSQDYLNLAPLPLRPRRILLANAAAIGIAVAVLALVVNGASIVFFPAFVTAADPSGSVGVGAFMGAHALSVLLASVFAFFTVFAILGTVSAVLPRHMFRAVSSSLRAVLLVACLALLTSGFAGNALLRTLKRAPDSAVSWLPTMWILGLYQNLQHRATPELAELAPRALESIGAVITLAVLVFALSYRRRFAAVLEGQRDSSSQRGRGIALTVLDTLGYRKPGFRRAAYRFALRALLRNEAQRLCLSVSLALGVLIAFQESVMMAPLVVAFLLILGLRAAFEIPATVSANWIFRTTVDARQHEGFGIARRVMLAFLAPLVLLPCVGYTWWQQGLADAALHTAYVLALSLVLMELLLWNYRKIPFTCLVPGFREKLPLMCFLQVLAFFVFTRAGTQVESWMFIQPARFAALPVALFLSWIAKRAHLRNALAAGERAPGVSFDSRLPGAVERFNLSGGD